MTRSRLAGSPLLRSWCTQSELSTRTGIQVRSRLASIASISSLVGNWSLNVPEYFTNSAIRRRRLNSSKTLTTASRFVVRA